MVIPLRITTSAAWMMLLPMVAIFLISSSSSSMFAAAAKKQKQPKSKKKVSRSSSFSLTALTEKYQSSQMEIDRCAVQKGCYDNAVFSKKGMHKKPKSKKGRKMAEQQSALECVAEKCEVKELRDHLEKGALMSDFVRKNFARNEVRETVKTFVDALLEQVYEIENDRKLEIKSGTEGGGGPLNDSRNHYQRMLTAVLPPYNLPQDPYLGPNPGATMHGDAWLSDTTNYMAPSDSTASSIIQIDDIGGQCYTASFNSAGNRLVLLCHTLPILDCFQPAISGECTLQTGTKLLLVERDTSEACWTNFGNGNTTSTCNPFRVLDNYILDGKGRAAGIYFYVDNNNRAVVANEDILVWFNVDEGSTNLTPELSIDLSSVMFNSKDQITSAFPGWDGTIWFESNAGIVGTIYPPPTYDSSSDTMVWDPDSSFIDIWTPPESIDPNTCPGVDCSTGIVKGMSVDDSGAYVLTNSMVAKFISPGPGSAPSIVWQYNYDRGTGRQPGMQSWGSGTSPKLFGSDGNYLAIADNANPRINVIVLDRTDGNLVCQLPIFKAGQSATTTSFVGYENSLFAVNDYGMQPGVSVPGAPGFIRVDVNPTAGTCSEIWSKGDTTNTGCLKLSTHTGLVYNNVNKKSAALIAATKTAKALVPENWIPLVDMLSNFLSDNYVLARNWATGKEQYKLPLNTGKGFFGGTFTLGEVNGWTFFVSNQIGPAGELYVGTLNSLKVIYDSSTS